MTVQNENDVIEAVCRMLEARGFVVIGRCSTRERGVDIHAERREPHATVLRIEAKGATSAEPGTNRYGNGFNGSQAADHVAKAIKTALEFVSAHPADRAAIALPDDRLHGKNVAAVAPALARLGIGVFWVSEDSSVRIDAPWEL